MSQQRKIEPEIFDAQGERLVRREDVAFVLSAARLQLQRDLVDATPRLAAVLQSGGDRATLDAAWAVEVMPLLQRYERAVLHATEVGHA